MTKREKALKVINELHKKGILKDYAIGGAVATIFYTEPFFTRDIDIFFIPAEKKGIPIQFIPATTELEIEALKNAIDAKVKDINIRVLRPEYLIAIFLKVFRSKDKEKIRMIAEQAEIDKKLLSDILDRYKLKKRFWELLNE